MFVEHCLGILRGESVAVVDAEVSDLTSIMFRLSSGVRVKNLESIKTSMFMIECIKLSCVGHDGGPDTECMLLFDNFIDYTCDHYSSVMASVLIKYAFKDRKLSIRCAQHSSRWHRISALFETTLGLSVNGKSTQFARCYRRIGRCSSVSDQFNHYICTQLGSSIACWHG